VRGGMRERPEMTPNNRARTAAHMPAGLRPANAEFVPPSG
jgi:hypothetical protein